MPEFQLPPGYGPERVDRALTASIDGVSRATVQRWIDAGRVRVNSRPARAKDRVAGGDIITYDPAPEPPTAAEPDAAVQFAVLYEDADLIVIDKPPGLVVHPARGNLDGTLVNGLLARPGFERVVDARDPEGQRRPGIVHRIDKGTSGILVVAKSVAAREGLKAQFSAHSIERAYLAISVGVPRPGRIETCYGRHPTQRLKFTSVLDVGKRAVTNVEVLERLAQGCALIQCRLETGRTHQIRVHLAEQARCPLLGDALYGARNQSGPLEQLARTLGRQALHAAHLGFTHPVTGAKLSFDTPAPADFAAALEALQVVKPS